MRRCRRRPTSPRRWPPPDASFPGRAHRRRSWFRAAVDRPGADRGCWRFASAPPPASSEEGGRFDLAAPRGTCYLASTPLAAARERLGRPGRLVAAEEVEGAVVSQVRFAPGRVADLLHRDAALHGVTRELCASAPYRLGQQWAAVFDAAGFDGIVYPPRFSTDAAESLAAFGPAGVPDSSPGVIAATSVAEVLRRHGCTVAGRPPRWRRSARCSGHADGSAPRARGTSPSGVTTRTTPAERISRAHPSHGTSVT